MTAAERRRLVGILGRLGSNHDGERAAAGLLADRLLRSAGLTWEQLVPAFPATVIKAEVPCSGWRAELAVCRRHVGFLRPWEQGFVNSLASRSSVTTKQRTTLGEIADALRARGRA